MISKQANPPGNTVHVRKPPNKHLANEEALLGVAGPKI